MAIERIAVVEDHDVVNIIERDTALPPERQPQPLAGQTFYVHATAEIGWTESGGVLSPPPGGLPGPLRSIDSYSFWMRLPSGKRQAVLASTNGAIRDWLAQLYMFGAVDLDSAWATDGTQALVTASLITSGERDAMLANVSI